MKFGKFEISEYCIGAIAIIVFVIVVLHFTIKEEELKEKTKQLELEKEIVYMNQSKEDVINNK